MDFDEFDAPQFVDFSQENFDASQEGDSWFSNDSSDLQVEEVEDSPIDWNGFLRDIDQTKTPSRALPLWARNPPGVPPTVVVDVGPTSPSSTTTTSSTTSAETVEHAGLPEMGATAAAPATAAPISRWRQATKRASLEQQRRLSLSSSRPAEARRKATQRARGSLRSTAKHDEDGELTPAKRVKTDERPKRKIPMNEARVTGLPQHIPKPMCKDNARASARNLLSNTTTITNPTTTTTTKPNTTTTNPTTTTNGSRSRYNHRKRNRDLDGNVASSQPVVRFSAKNALGARQTFQFGGIRKVGPSTSSLPSASTTATAPSTTTTTAATTTSEESADVIRFQARPAPSTSSNLFQPKLGRRRCIEVKEFHFHTKERAQSRRELDAIRAESQARLREVEEQRRREQEEKERLEIKRLREALVHKATPINIGPPFIVSASSKRLTSPESPQLSHKQNKRES